MSGLNIWQKKKNLTLALFGIKNKKKRKWLKMELSRSVQLWSEKLAQQIQVESSFSASFLDNSGQEHLH